MFVKYQFLRILVAIALISGMSSCVADQCTTCSYTDPMTNTLITEPEVCGSKTIIESEENNAKVTAELWGATDFSCTRK
ncbi:MAG: hypothetical protein AAF985_04880 [Bacteroidota bacterium]